MIVGVSTTVIITVVAHILQVAQGVDMLRDQHKDPEPPLLDPLNDGYTRIIITDTVTHAIDTMRLVDYSALKKEGKVDTVNKKTKLFYPGVTYKTFSTFFLSGCCATHTRGYLGFRVFRVVFILEHARKKAISGETICQFSAVRPYPGR